VSARVAAGLRVVYRKTPLRKKKLKTGGGGKKRGESKLVSDRHLGSKGDEKKTERGCLGWL